MLVKLKGKPDRRSSDYPEIKGELLHTSGEGPSYVVLKTKNGAEVFDLDDYDILLPAEGKKALDKFGA
jgi:hypothetical protein